MYPVQRPDDRNFFLPDDHRYPVLNETCKKIILLLQDRNWNFPGIAVDWRFDKKSVRSIIGEDFKIEFQVNSTRWPHALCILNIEIPWKCFRMDDNPYDLTYREIINANADKRDFGYGDLDRNILNFEGSTVKDDVISGREYFVESYSSWQPTYPKATREWRVANTEVNEINDWLQDNVVEKLTIMS